MVFVKNFDMSHQTLAGVGHFYVHRHMRVLDLAAMINERMGFPSSTPLKIYEVCLGLLGRKGGLLIDGDRLCRRSSRT